jgi:hypothetical protein
MEFMNSMFGDNTTPMQQTALPADDTAMQLELKRRLKMAEALQQQAMPEGQMVSGHYVAPSWTQYLANAYGKYQGGKQEREALGQFGEYQKAKQAKLANLLTDLGQGKEVTEPMDYNEAGNMPGMMQTTRQPYTQQEFMAKALEVNPSLGDKFLENKIASYAPKKPIELGSGAKLLNPDTYEVLANNPKEGAKFTNIQQDKAGNSFGFNTETNKFEQLPGAQMTQEQWSPPYNLNGQFVQKNLITGKIDQAVHLPTQNNTQVNMPKVETSARIESNQDFSKNVYRPTLDSAAKNSIVLSRLDALEKLPINEKTGWGTQAKAAATNVLLGLGYNNEEAKSLASNAQTFKAIQARQVNEELNAAKGPQTEGDAQRAASAYASLGNTPQANQFINSLQRAIIKRKNAEAAFYRKNYNSALQAGDLSQLERDWMDSPEAAKSIFDYPEMKAWTSASPNNNLQPKPAPSLRWNPKTNKLESM